MGLGAVQIDELSELHLQALIDNEVPEGRGIDYKLTLPGTTNDAKKEFLADVSSFANAGGGDIVFGVDESAGLPTDLQGLSDNLDEAMLRIESSIRDGIAPRIQGIASKPVPFANGTQALVLRVPRSLSRPHVVVFRNHWKFYTRSSNGKHQMDIDEVRAAFVGSEALADRIRAFRRNRIELIASGDGPVLLSGDALAVLHVVPLSAFDSLAPAEVDLEVGLRSGIRPPGSGGSSRYNFDGVVTEGRGADGIEAYVQLFRTGIVEGATTYPFGPEGGRPAIAINILEEHMIEALENYLGLQRRLGVEAPTLVMLSLVGVRGYRIPHGSARRHRPVDRDNLLLPETMIGYMGENAVPPDASQVLRRSFDAVWNACGYPASLNYREDRSWTGYR